MMASFIPVPALQAFSRQVIVDKSRTHVDTQYLLHSPLIVCYCMDYLHVKWKQKLIFPFQL